MPVWRYYYKFGLFLFCFLLLGRFYFYDIQNLSLFFVLQNFAYRNFSFVQPCGSIFFDFIYAGFKRSYAQSFIGGFSGKKFCFAFFVGFIVNGNAYFLCKMNPVRVICD